MNQAVLRQEDGSTVLLLVLEPGNLKRMRDGAPAEIRVDDFFPGGIPKRLRVAICYSDTPAADARAFAELAGATRTFDERTAAVENRRPHCPECRSTIEQLGAQRSEAPVVITFCPMCGCVLGTFLKTGATL